MLRVYLVDDEPPARARMRQLLAAVDDVVAVGEAADAIEAREGIAAARPDVVFLDIEMPELSGTALAASLPEPRPLIVFATAFERYAVDAFALEATDYLLKPITQARLAATLARVRDRLSRRSELERELSAASAVQAALLPRSMPQLPGFTAAAMTRAARGVGGDFFVAQQLARDRFVLALGDVAGKGLPAGLVASSLQARIESIARLATGTASEIVGDVNRAFCDTLDGARFATLAYVEVNTASGELTVVNAGHLPALLVTPGEPIETLPSTAAALGLLPQAEFQARCVTMQEGATLVLYSDGVTEACDAAGNEFGDERLWHLLDRSATKDPSHVCDAVLAAVRQHGSGPASDDVTVLALQRTVRAR
jgi:sigma-B regulation protein RsbU (phosphoserine phosphatase)